MTTPLLTRRASLVAGTAALAALASTRAGAAEPMSMPHGGDWFAMVQTHHAMVAKTFDALLASNGQLYAKRDRLLKLLKYQLTAHSVAEENTIYPMIASLGMMSDADKLYLDQAHAKVMNAELDMSTIDNKDDTTWVDKVRTLQTAVLHHAKDDEEANLFPALKSKLDDSRNMMLTAAYAHEFASVKPT